VSKGYIHDAKIDCSVHETKHSKLPQVIEINSTEEKINSFLQEKKLLLKASKIVMVQSEVVIQPLL